MTKDDGLDFMNDEDLREYIALIHKHTGITINDSRKSMIQGRLRKRIIGLGLKGFHAYLFLLKENSLELGHFIDLITTNETYFFRTPRIWKFIESVFLPEWSEANKDKIFNAWSAASSSGEEAHSIAVTCAAFKKLKPSFTFQIFASDISSEMVTLGQKGIYSGRSIESFQKTRPELFAQFMRPNGNESFVLDPEIRSKIRFDRHNLFLANQHKSKFDLILLRNVLIYFTPVDQETVLNKLSPALTPAGRLIIGESESLTYLQSDFIAVQPLIYRLKVASEKVGKVA